MESFALQTHDVGQNAVVECWGSGFIRSSRLSIGGLADGIPPLFEVNALGHCLVALITAVHQRLQTTLKGPVVRSELIWENMYVMLFCAYETPCQDMADYILQGQLQHWAVALAQKANPLQAACPPSQNGGKRGNKPNHRI